MLKKEKTTKKLNKVILASSIVATAGIATSVGFDISSSITNIKNNNNYTPLIRITYRNNSNEAQYDITNGVNYQGRSAELFVNVVNNESYKDGDRFTIQSDSISYSYQPNSSSDALSNISSSVAGLKFQLLEDGFFSGTARVTTAKKTLVGKIYCEVKIKDNKTGNLLSTFTTIPCRFEAQGKAHANDEDFYAHLRGTITESAIASPYPYLEIVGLYGMTVTNRILHYEKDLLYGLEFCDSEGNETDSIQISPDEDERNNGIGRIYLKGKYNGTSGETWSIGLGITNSTGAIVTTKVSLFVRTSGSPYAIYNQYLTVNKEANPSAVDPYNFITFYDASGDELLNTEFSVVSDLDGITFTDGDGNPNSTNGEGKMYIHGKPTTKGSYLLQFIKDEGNIIYVNIYVTEEEFDLLEVAVPQNNTTVRYPWWGTGSMAAVQFFRITFEYWDPQWHKLPIEGLITTSDSQFTNINIKSLDGSIISSPTSMATAIDSLAGYYTVNIEDTNIVFYWKSKGPDYSPPARILTFDFTPILIGIDVNSYQHETTHVEITIQEERW